MVGEEEALYREDGMGGVFWKLQGKLHSLENFALFSDAH